MRLEGGGMRLAAAIDAADVPRALQDLVRARLAVLDPDERATLDAASVQGYAFDPDLVARVRGLPRIHVLEILGRLERRHGLVHSASKLLRFDHHLLQEVVYGELPPVLRAELHDRLADAIDASASPDASYEVAAARIAPHRLRGAEPARVLPILTPALVHLAKTFRHEAAFDLARGALALTELGPGETRVGILIRLAHLAASIGRPKERREALDEAVALSDRLGATRLRGRAYAARVHQWMDAGEYERALAAADTSVALATETADKVSLADATGQRGQALWCLGRLAESRACQEAARRIAQEAGSVRFEAHASSNLGVVLHEMGFYEEAEASYRHAQRLMRETADAMNLATATTNLGNLLADVGRKAEALACYEASLAISREVVHRGTEAGAWVNLGELHLRLGDIPAARDAFHRCREICRETGLRREGAFATHGLGLAAAWAGDRALARAQLDEALRERREIRTPPAIADTLLCLGDPRSRGGRPGRGEGPPRRGRRDRGRHRRPERRHARSAPPRAPPGRGRGARAGRVRGPPPAAAPGCAHRGAVAALAPQREPGRPRGGAGAARRAVRARPAGLAGPDARERALPPRHPGRGAERSAGVTSAKPILVVGAGFAGATHARVLAEHGHRVEVIDRRPHLAGNAFDEVDANGRAATRLRAPPLPHEQRPRDDVARAVRGVRPLRAPRHREAPRRPAATCPCPSTARRSTPCSASPWRTRRRCARTWPASPSRTRPRATPPSTCTRGSASR